MRRGLLAAVLGASIALMVPVVPVAAACAYWSSTYTATKTAQVVGTTSSWGTWYTMTVHYHLYVGCPNYALTQIKINDFSTSVRFKSSNYPGDPNHGHKTRSAPSRSSSPVPTLGRMAANHLARHNTHQYLY